ncbi:MAG: hypothetical protein KBT82_04320 [Marinobacter sp.]|uniref:opioid growth factor receptor-related protein n=1 Tax=Marinobacter sp. TaxID=50741 RepID=UPI001B622307|nr:opioid growth factor receptor-related protein [Marinobacter sp.]MBQ0747673.1 hypothetical protein [Marinobacter sp.]MBQ0813396.1 hypothetical protein [Marinobacter sp.]
MIKRVQAWKVGSAHPIHSVNGCSSEEVLLDRSELAQLSPELRRLTSGTLILTASPDFPAICVYSMERWEYVREQLEALPNMNPDARQLQRRMLGHAHWFDEGEALIISSPLAGLSGLSDNKAKAWLISFDQDTAELWTEDNLLNLVNMHAPEESNLITFIRGEGTDHRGRTLNDVLAMDDFWLEHTHDYIQWLFPIPEPSRANVLAPVLTEADRENFQKDDELKRQHQRALDRMLAFYGLRRNGSQVEALPGLNIREHIWLKAGGHNHLRITRMIRSLHYCHQPALAKAIQSAFVTIGQSFGQVGGQTVGYWLRAID